MTSNRRLIAIVSRKLAQLQQIAHCLQKLSRLRSAARSPEVAYVAVSIMCELCDRVSLKSLTNDKQFPVEAKRRQLRRCTRNRQRTKAGEVNERLVAVVPY